MNDRHKQTDERDIMFARLNYQSGTKQYRDFYNRYPELKDKDDEFRTRPATGDENSTFFNQNHSQIVNANFDFLADIKHLSKGEPCGEKVDGTKEQFTQTIKGLARYYGACLVGVAEVTQDLYYSHHGRPLEKYGEKIDPKYTKAIVFAYEMNDEMIFRAPRLSEAIAVTNGYVQAAIGGMQLSYYIRRIGYNARNNMDGNYLCPLVPLAVVAGIGELGKNGLLLTERFGSRLRLGAVLTDLPLVADKPLEKNLSLFCERCERCIKSCPGKALEPVEGEYFSDNNCFHMWQVLGTDCGVCIASCPFSSHIPQELTKDLNQSENLEKLLNYCDQNHARRAFIKDDPEWLR